MFFQHKLNRTWQEGTYADLFEETLYNAVLGGLDLEGRNFNYTNPLDASHARYPWHVCPCCVGNLPRTLLSLPTWMYATGADGVTVNLYAGSTVNLGEIAGTPVQVVQTTDYPWKGAAALTLNPAEARRFTVRLRIPNRQTSELYTPAPTINGLVSLTVNGKAVNLRTAGGYAAITRRWQAGDRIELELPLVAQRITASDKISATRGRVALRYGPLIYNAESVDQNLDGVLSPDSRLTTEWRADLLGGVLAIKGEFNDGKPLLAIPNYARLNRGGRSIVWLKAD